VPRQRVPAPYPPEFRAEAIRLVRSGDRKLSEIADDLGVSQQSLRNWVRQADLDDGRRHDGLTTDDRAEVARLRRENRVLREERDILKKAAAFFANETMK
jgi:transposase